MTREDKAREIVRQGGKCDGVSCDFEDGNECPIYRLCESLDGNSEIHPDKVAACQRFLGQFAPKPVKTLLDEYAIAAMQGLISITKPAGASMTMDEIFEELAKQAYSQAAAMMREKMRRDEMGNVKEVGDE